VAPETGEIDRKALGKKVFGASSELKKLTDIVWPEIERLLHAQIEQLFVAGNRLVVVEAAVLIEAGWHTRMNEVWVTFVNDEEATRRAVERDGSSLEKIQATLAAQLSNKKRLAVANVALCSLWDREYTIKQVAKALDLLKQRTTVNFQAYSKNL
jgi:phosphopantetheine adenylyltransferase/dephospho-CoA kinase